jgi:DNA-binding response OmpR family regulator
LKTILIVDDEPADVLELILDAQGYRVLTAIDGRQGLELLEQSRVDLVISDVMMPVMDGAEMVGILRRRPGGARLPVLIVSALTESAVRHLLIDYDAFMRKPMSIAELLINCERLLGRDSRVAPPLH